MSDSVQNAEGFVSLQEASRILGVSIETVYRLIGRGDLTKYRLQTDRRRTVLSKSELEALKAPKIDDRNSREIADAVSAIG